MSGVLFRFNAGSDIGYGHASRCICLAKHLPIECEISFVIYSDNPDSVLSFIKTRERVHYIRDTIFLNNKTAQEDLYNVIKYVKANGFFLVLDHYDVNEEYQIQLLSAGVHWLQLDSMAKQKFYANYVQHGSPGATDDMYKNLKGNNKTVFLLGPKYAIIDDSFSTLHKTVRTRNSIKRVLLSFGGGNAKGAICKYLSHLAHYFSSLDFLVVIKSTIFELYKLKDIAKKYQNVHLCIDIDNIAELMCSSDLAILAPGVMSYEAATVGLPLILIATEENQFINLKGCAKIGLAKSLGFIDQVSPDKLCNSLDMLINRPSIIQEMSSIALKNFDGNGVNRIINQIMNEL